MATIPQITFVIVFLGENVCFLIQIALYFVPYTKFTKGSTGLGNGFATPRL